MYRSKKFAPNLDLAMIRMLMDIESFLELHGRMVTNWDF